MQPAITKCLLWKMCLLAPGPSSPCLTATLPFFQLVVPKCSSEEIHGARAERYDLCAICQKSVSDRELERAEAQHFAALIAHGIFSSMPVLEVTSSGIPRSRRQLAGL